MIRIPLILIALLVLPLVAGCGGGGSGAAALSHIERPGLYAENTVELDAEGRDELRASGIALEDAGEFVAAAEYWYGVAYEHPRDPLAIEARHHRVSCLVQLREFWLAHQDMTVLVQLYKEWLLLTRYQAQWDELRRLWYEDIGLGLYFKDEKRDHLADNLDPAIKVFERLYKEEVRGRYSALCLLRLGDCRYQQQEYEEARNHYLRVVTSYADYQDHSEHEEAVYKSARATLAMMKGVDYNLDMIR
ncbi:MAG: tol-pal system YbgF family protein, partial [Planctomycetota bacterium]